MKTSTLCKICVNLRNDYEKDGYTLSRKFSGCNLRIWWYHHANNNRLTIELDLNRNHLNIYKNSLRIVHYE